MAEDNKFSNLRLVNYIMAAFALSPLAFLYIKRGIEPAPQPAAVAEVSQGAKENQDPNLQGLVDSRKAEISENVRAFLDTKIDEIKLDLSHYKTAPKSVSNDRKIDAESELLAALEKLQDGKRDFKNYIATKLLANQQPEASIRTEVETLHGQALMIAGLDDLNYKTARKEFSVETRMLADLSSPSQGK